jgi:hypothetical protein
VTWSQLDDSAKAPWTRMMVDCMIDPFCQGEYQEYESESHQGPPERDA